MRTFSGRISKLKFPALDHLKKNEPQIDIHPSVLCLHQRPSLCTLEINKTFNQARKLFAILVGPSSPLTGRPLKHDRRVQSALLPRAKIRAWQTVQGFYGSARTSGAHPGASRFLFHQPECLILVLMIQDAALTVISTTQG